MMSTIWEEFYQRTVKARYKAMLRVLNERRREAGLSCMSQKTLKWMAKYGPDEFEDAALPGLCSPKESARLIRDNGILVPPPNVLMNTNEPTPYIMRVLLAFDDLIEVMKLP